MKMKYYSQQAVHENTLFNRCIPNDIGPSPRRLSLKPNRSVHFSNDIIFQEHVRQGDLEQIGRFIRAGKINLNTIYLSGMAALHEAVLSGNLESVKLLVKSGADIHQQDEDGWTPLHIACSDGFPDIARLQRMVRKTEIRGEGPDWSEMTRRYLLSMGASVDVENKCGEKPADLIDSECPELVKLFEKVCD